MKRGNVSRLSSLEERCCLTFCWRREWRRKNTKRGLSAGMLSLVIAVTFSLWSAAGIIKTNCFNLQVWRSLLYWTRKLNQPSRSQTVFPTSINVFQFLCENSCWPWKCEVPVIIWHLELPGDGYIVGDFSCRVNQNPLWGLWEWGLWGCPQGSLPLKECKFLSTETWSLFRKDNEWEYTWFHFIYTHFHFSHGTLSSTLRSM